MKHTILFLVLLQYFNIHAQPVDDGRLIHVPVIFHVISSKKVPQVDQSVTKELLQKEIADLNANFSATNDMTVLEKDFEPLVGNANIKFHLLDSILQPNGEPGVIRVNVGRKKYGLEHQIKPEAYLNIYVGAFGNVTVVNGKKVHINYTDIGAGGGTVTHELGHYFGLWHLWGKSNCKKIKWFTDRDDYIADTPVQKNCTDLSRKKPCPIDNTKGTNYNNFMDYNGCRCMFTKGQSQAMRTNIIKHRISMYTNSGVLAEE